MNSKGLVTIDVSQLPSLSVESYFHTAYDAWNIVTDSSNHAFIADLSGGFKILDYSNPSSPQLIGQFNPDESVNDVAIKNKFAYLLCDSDLRVLDISNLAEPKQVAKLTINDTVNNSGVSIPTFLCINDSTIYVTTKSESLFTIAMSDPNSPRILNSCSLTGPPVGICESNDHIYVADQDTGIQIFNISNPAAPKQEGFLRIVPLNSLSIMGNKLFVVGRLGAAVGQAGFSEYDISQPLNPIFKYTLTIPGGIAYSWIAVEKNFAYITDRGTFLVADVSDSDSGKIMDSENADNLGFYSFDGIAVSNGVILLSLADQGIITLRNTLDAVHALPPPPDIFRLFQNYPNPFNPTTVIRFEVRSSGFVSLKVYDVLGRLVKTLVSKTEIAGSHQVSFDGAGLSSGVYFYRLQAGSYLVTKKMLLLK